MRANKLVLLSILIFSLFACGDGGSSDTNPSYEPKASTPQGQEADSSYGSRSLIVGRWKEVEPSTGCVSVYTFRADGTFSGISLDELTAGVYSISDRPNKEGLYKFIIKATSDNGQYDCYGSNDDDSHVEVTYYMKFSSNNNVAVFYDAPVTSTESFVGKMTRI